jgi:hypothetical protein
MGNHPEGVMRGRIHFLGLNTVNSFPALVEQQVNKGSALSRHAEWLRSRP